MRFCWFHFLMLFSAFVSGEPATLTEVAQIRALTPEMAREHHPVLVEGVVIYFDRHHGHAFIQDDTGSVFFRPGMHGSPGAAIATAGERVIVEGITWAGEFSPSIAGRPLEMEGEPGPVKLTHLGPGEFPEPVPVPFNQLKTGRWHDQFVSIRGTVRKYSAAAGEGPRSLSLVLSGPEGRSIEAWGNELDAGDAQEWINQEITLHGVVAGGGDALGRLEDAHLLIGDSSWLIRDDQAMAEAFDQQPMPLESLRRYLPPEVRNRRVRIDGTISLVDPDEGFFLTDGNLGIRVVTPQSKTCLVGDVVTVTGYLSDEGLGDGIVRVLARGSPPAARLVAADELKDEAVQSALVSVKGVLRGIWSRPSGVEIRIEADGVLLSAIGPGVPAGLETGSRLLLTAVVVEGGLRMRGMDDVVVLSSAPWLTPGKRNALIAGIGLALLMGILWVVSLKFQLARQTRLIEAQLVHRTLVEERQRMGRELHDSLEQYLAGLHLQLETLRDHIADGPESVQELASGAARMLEHCRDEARRSVFELRTQTFQREGFAAALVQFAEEVNPGGIPRVTIEVLGESRPVDSAAEFHLLRCAQEAVVNALKHADAREIGIELRYLTDEVRVLVSDDGKGFDPAGPLPAGRPGFGLRHLKERVDRIRGCLRINSEPGRGTIVTISLSA